MEKKEAIYLDTEKMPFMDHLSKNNDNKMMYEKDLLKEDLETKMSVSIKIYPKGFYTKWHRHNCSHGIYVLEGKLKTDKGVFGKGTFVWFDEGVLASHGATEEEDVKVMFITNKKFDIVYEKEL